MEFREKKQEEEPRFKFENRNRVDIEPGLKLTAEEVAEELLPTYIYVKQLGEGTQGRVVLARDTRIGGRPVAIKLLLRGAFVTNFRRYFAREITHHSSLLHPFVIACYEVFLTTRCVGIAMEWATGGSLHTLLNKQHNCRFPEHVARAFFQQLILGIDYVHRRGVANRDMKLENLLLDAVPSANPRQPCPLIKICDFGYSKHDENSNAYTTIGTPNYMAPEVIQGDCRYDPFIADIWSAGIILYVMLMGRYPYDKDEKGHVIILPVMRGEWHPFDASVPLSASVKEIITGMLETDPKKRLTLKAIMATPWFREGLPPGCLDMNDMWIDLAPKAFEAPLSRVADFVGDLLMVATGEGTPGDGSENMRCELPCGELLNIAIVEGHLANGPIPAHKLSEIFRDLRMKKKSSFRSMDDGENNGSSTALTYNESPGAQRTTFT